MKKDVIGDYESNNSRGKLLSFLRNILPEDVYGKIAIDANMRDLEEMYPDELIDEMQVHKTGEKVFLIKKKDMDNLPKNWQSTLDKLADIERLENPIYVELGDNGLLLIE